MAVGLFLTKILRTVSLRLRSSFYSIEYRYTSSGASLPPKGFSEMAPLFCSGMFDIFSFSDMVQCVVCLFVV